MLTIIVAPQLLFPTIAYFESMFKTRDIKVSKYPLTDVINKTRVSNHVSNVT